MGFSELLEVMVYNSFALTKEVGALSKEFGALKKQVTKTERKLLSSAGDWQAGLDALQCTAVSLIISVPMVMFRVIVTTTPLVTAPQLVALCNCAFFAAAFLGFRRTNRR